MPSVHRRRSLRLRRFDYATPGAYFVTVCAQDHRCLFGEVVEGVFRPNSAGEMVTAAWRDLPAFYAGVEVDAFVAMPTTFTPSWFW